MVWAGRSGDQIPVRANIFATVQSGCGAHRASCTMGAGSFSQGSSQGMADHPPPSNAKVKERVELYLFSLMGLENPTC